MRILTDKQREVLDRLLVVANGDPILLQKGLRHCSSDGNINADNLKELLRYLKQNRKKPYET